MSRQTQEILALLARRGTLTTRVREQSVGDVHDIPSMLPASLGMTVRPKDAAAVLEELEQQQAVRRLEAVHAYDSTEYIVTWYVAGQRRDEQAGAHA